MLEISSLLAAMTIAGAFWVGVLAARRLRDWGDGNRAIEERESPEVLGGRAKIPSQDRGSARVRALVSQRIDAEFGDTEKEEQDKQGKQGKQGKGTATREAESLKIDALRCGDVVLVEAADANFDGDFLVEGVLRLREGSTTTMVVVMADGDRRRCLVGGAQEGVGQPWAEKWLLLEAIEDHAMRGEPPRNIRPRQGLGRERSYALDRRGQASVAAVGEHGRPSAARVSTYVYRSSLRDVLWVERYGDELFLAAGVAVPRFEVSFLPGS